MLQGLLRHDTDAEIESNVTDTHGASIIGFAFCELLGFQLKATFKQIGKMRLYTPGLDSDQPWPAIASVISARAINWGFIADPSPYELERFFRLDADRLRLLKGKRRDVNRLGFAVQGGTVRMPGTFLGEDPTAVPAGVAGFVAEQLGVRLASDRSVRT